MKLSARIVRLELAETLVISRGTRDAVDAVQVELLCGSVIGHGEATPIARYGESADSAFAFLNEHAELVGVDPWAHTSIHGRLADIPGEQAAKAALDAALFDLRGKLVGLPVYQLLGLPRIAEPTALTLSLSDPDSMARQAERADHCFGALKLKLGGRDGLDVERVRAVRSVTRLPLRVDVNEGWSLDEALDELPRLEDLGVELCEQPLPAGDREGRRLRELAPMPIYVDEDCHTLADVAACAEIAHGINIKLVKAGGITEALSMLHGARALGLKVMLGCTVESSLGIAAGAAIATLCDQVDLDGNLLLARDPWEGVDLIDGAQVPSGEPGLGVKPARIRHRVTASL